MDTGTQTRMHLGLGADSQQMIVQFRNKHATAVAGLFILKMPLLSDKLYVEFGNVDAILTFISHYDLDNKSLTALLEFEKRKKRESCFTVNNENVHSTIRNSGRLLRYFTSSRRPLVFFTDIHLPH